MTRVDVEQFVGAHALAGDGDAGDLVRVAVGEVEIDQHAWRHALGNQFLQQRRRMLFGRLPNRIEAARRRAIGLRQREGGNAENRALDRAGDRARIGDVLRDVLPAVDAGQDDIGLLVLQDVAHAHDDAVGWRAAYGETPLADLAQPQGIGQRHGMGDAGLVGLGRDGEDVVGELGGDLFQHFEAGAVDAVVVGDEYAHSFLSLSPFTGRGPG